MARIRPNLGSGRTLSLVTGTPTLVSLTPDEQRSGIFVLQGPPSQAERKVCLSWGSATIPATGMITEVNGADHVNGETVTISDGTTNDYGFGPNGSVTFEYSTVPIPPPNVRIDYTGLNSVGLAQVLRDAINASALLITATTEGVLLGQVALTNQQVGAIGNVAIVETVANVGYVVSGMAGGVDIADPDLGTPGDP